MSNSTYYGYEGLFGTRTEQRISASAAANEIGSVFQKAFNCLISPTLSHPSTNKVDMERFVSFAAMAGYGEQAPALDIKAVFNFASSDTSDKVIDFPSFLVAVLHLQMLSRKKPLGHRGILEVLTDAASHHIVPYVSHDSVVNSDRTIDSAMLSTPAMFRYRWCVARSVQTIFFHYSRNQELILGAHDFLLQFASDFNIFPFVLSKQSMGRVLDQSKALGTQLDMERFWICLVHFTFAMYEPDATAFQSYCTVESRFHLFFNSVLSPGLRHLGFEPDDLLMNPKDIPKAIAQSVHPNEIEWNSQEQRLVLNGKDFGALGDGLYVQFLYKPNNMDEPSVPIVLHTHDVEEDGSIAYLPTPKITPEPVTWEGCVVEGSLQNADETTFKYRIIYRHSIPFRAANSSDEFLLSDVAMDSTGGEKLPSLSLLQSTEENTISPGVVNEIRNIFLVGATQSAQGNKDYLYEVGWNYLVSNHIALNTAEAVKASALFRSMATGNSTDASGKTSLNFSEFVHFLIYIVKERELSLDAHEATLCALLREGANANRPKQSVRRLSKQVYPAEVSDESQQILRHATALDNVNMRANKIIENLRADVAKRKKIVEERESQIERYKMCLLCVTKNMRELESYMKVFADHIDLDDKKQHAGVARIYFDLCLGVIDASAKLASTSEGIPVEGLKQFLTNNDVKDASAKLMALATEVSTKSELFQNLQRSEVAIIDKGNLSPLLPQKEGNDKGFENRLVDQETLRNDLKDSKALICLLQNEIAELKQIGVASDRALQETQRREKFLRFTVEELKEMNSTLILARDRRIKLDNEFKKEKAKRNEPAMGEVVRLREIVTKLEADLITAQKKRTEAFELEIDERPKSGKKGDRPKSPRSPNSPRSPRKTASKYSGVGTFPEATSEKEHFKHWKNVREVECQTDSTGDIITFDDLSASRPRKAQKVEQFVQTAIKGVRLGSLDEPLVDASKLIRILQIQYRELHLYVSTVFPVYVQMFQAAHETFQSFRRGKGLSWPQALASGLSGVYSPMNRSKSRDSSPRAPSAATRVVTTDATHRTGCDEDTKRDSVATTQRTFVTECVPEVKHAKNANDQHTEGDKALVTALRAPASNATLKLIVTPVLLGTPSNQVTDTNADTVTELMPLSRDAEAVQPIPDLVKELQMTRKDYVLAICARVRFGILLRALKRRCVPKTSDDRKQHSETPSMMNEIARLEKLLEKSRLKVAAKREDMNRVRQKLQQMRASAPGPRVKPPISELVVSGVRALSSSLPRKVTEEGKPQLSRETVVHAVRVACTSTPMKKTEHTPVSPAGLLTITSLRDPSHKGNELQSQHGRGGSRKPHNNKEEAQVDVMRMLRMIHHRNAPPPSLLQTQGVQVSTRNPKTTAILTTPRIPVPKGERQEKVAPARPPRGAAHSAGPNSAKRDGLLLDTLPDTDFYKMLSGVRTQRMHHTLTAEISPLQVAVAPTRPLEAPQGSALPFRTSRLHAPM